ncbi:MAG: MerR family transcriptional regulator, partial [Thermomicrobiales bacterium]
MPQASRPTQPQRPMRESRGASKTSCDKVPGCGRTVHPEDPFPQEGVAQSVCKPLTDSKSRCYSQRVEVRRVARFDDLNEEPIYNTRAVVQRTGVPADTFRAWERRHGLPSPVRTSGNQRLYSEQDIALVNWLRDRTASGMTITQAIALFRSQNGTPHVNGSDPGATAAQLPGGDAGSSLPGIVHRLVDALINLDGTTADRIVEDALVMTTVESVCLDVLQATLVQIGHLWERDQAGIASEHYASAFVQRKFASLFNQSNPHEGRGPVVSACPEGEQHEIGLLLTSLFLSRRGYKIVYLGSNLPLHDLVGT